MKLKQQPDDFYVEELTDVSAGERGPFAFYRLVKRGWTTPDAVAIIRRRWHLEAQRIAFGGLKDRHAQTTQYLTILHGPPRGLTDQGINLEYLGEVDTPYASRCIRANRFRVTLRDLSAEQTSTAKREAAKIRRDGVPNYFDDQRFGSVTTGQEFVAKLMVKGQFEDALRLALTAPYEFERAHEKRSKAALDSFWGNWAECERRLPHGHIRGLVTYLARHPHDFRGTLAQLRPELQGLFLSAYQSHLWNRILAARLVEIVQQIDLRSIQLKLGELAVPSRLDDEQRALLTAETIRLPAARWPFDAAAPWAEAAQAVLAEEGLTWEELKIKGMRKPFFTRGDRAALCIPSALTVETGADDRHPGRSLLRLAFELPRGSYATIVVKRILL